MELASEPGLLPTPKQIDYARDLSIRLKAEIPPDAGRDRRQLSDWISAQLALLNTRKSTLRAPGASSRQVRFAEQIARRKRRQVPDECFRDASLMSRWIDSNL